VRGGLAVGFCYLLTFAAVLFIGINNPDPIYGHVQAVNSFFTAAGAGWLAPVTIALELAGLVGIGAAWLAAPARVPFAIGLNHYLPRAFGRVHPKFGTPYVALLAQAAIATTLVVIYTYNATLRDAYLTMLGSSIVLVMVTYIYLLAAWLRLVPAGRGAKLLGAVCVAAAALAVVGGFVPPSTITNPLAFELKLCGSVLVMLGSGLVVYLLNTRPASWREPGDTLDPLRAG
jgi:amino acid transporter